MSYIFQYGATPTTNMQPVSTGEALFHFKELLKAAGWGIRAWGDGTSGFSNDPGTDGITTPEIMDTDGAWFVIQQPTYAAPDVGAPGGRMFQFRNCKTTYNGYWQTVYLPLDNSGVPQTISTPGTATSCPRWPFAECLLRGSIPNGGGPWWGGTVGANRVSIGADDAAPYSCYMVAWVAGSTPADLASVGGTFVFDPLVAGSFPEEDTDPVVVYSPSPAQAAFAYSGLGNETTTNNSYAPRGFFRKGQTGAAFGFAPVMLYTNSALTRLYPAAMGTNPHTGKDDGAPLMYGRRPYQQTATYYPAGWKGISSVMRWVGTTAPTRTPLTKDTARDRIVIGSVTLPWDGSTPVP